MEDRKRMQLVGFLSLVFGIMAGVFVFSTSNPSPETTYEPWWLWQGSVVVSLLWVLMSAVTKLKLMFTGSYGKIGRITGVGSCLLLVSAIASASIVARVGPAPVFHPIESIFIPIWCLSWFFVDALSSISE